MGSWVFPENSFYTVRFYCSLSNKQNQFLHQSLALEKCRAAEETVDVVLAASAAAAVEGNLLTSSVFHFVFS